MSVWEQAYAAGKAAGISESVKTWMLVVEERSRPTYSHRNGEADEPTVEGFYFTSEQPDMMLPMGFWYVRHFSVRDGWDTQPSYIIAIYGPIPMPTRKESDT